MNTILKSILIGICTAIACIVFGGLFAGFFNGFSLEAATITGMLAFLCIVVVVCCGIIVAKIEKK